MPIIFLLMKKIIIRDMNKTNDPSFISWVDVSESSDFPIQNLPFGIIKISERK